MTSRGAKSIERASQIDLCAMISCQTLFTSSPRICARGVVRYHLESIKIYTHENKNNSQNACMRRRKIRLMMFWISKSEIWTLMLSPGVGIEFHTNTHSYTHLDRSTTAKKESWTWTWISQMKHDAAACLWNMSNLRNCKFRFDHHPPELSNLSLTELFVIVIDRSRPLNLSHYIVLRLIVCMFHDVNQFNAPCEDFSIIDWILYCLLDKSWAFN